MTASFTDVIRREKEKADELQSLRSCVVIPGSTSITLLYCSVVESRSWDSFSISLYTVGIAGRLVIFSSSWMMWALGSTGGPPASASADAVDSSRAFTRRPSR